MLLIFDMPMSDVCIVEGTVERDKIHMTAFCVARKGPWRVGVGVGGMGISLKVGFQALMAISLVLVHNPQASNWSMTWMREAANQSCALRADY